MFMYFLTSQLEAYKNRDNFPIKDWEKRGLYPSNEDVRQGMNLAVAEFADFLISKISNGMTESTELQNAIQTYFDEHDNDDFDTEEREYIVDVQCKLIQLVGVDCNSLFV